MTEGKHTPGPWIVDIGPDVIEILHPDNLDGELFGIAQLTHPEDEQAVANAYFIVTACNAHDDLLAACESAESVLSDLAAELCERQAGDYASYFNGAYGHGRRVILALQYAIARAKGEQS